MHIMRILTGTTVLYDMADFQNANKFKDVGVYRYVLEKTDM